MEELKAEIKELRDNTVRNCEKNKTLLNEYLLLMESKKKQIVNQIERNELVINLTNELCELYLSHSTDTIKIKKLNTQITELHNKCIAFFEIMPEIFS